MAIVGKGDWVIVRTASEQQANSDSSRFGTVYKGVVVKFGPGVSDLVEGNTVIFDSGRALSTYHAGTSQNIFFIDKTDVICTDN